MGRAAEFLSNIVASDNIGTLVLQRMIQHRRSFASAASKGGTLLLFVNLFSDFLYALHQFIAVKFAAACMVEFATG